MLPQLGKAAPVRCGVGVAGEAAHSELRQDVNRQGPRPRAAVELLEDLAEAVAVCNGKALSSRGMLAKKHGFLCKLLLPRIAPPSSEEAADWSKKSCLLFLGGFQQFIGTIAEMADKPFIAIVSSIHVYSQHSKEAQHISVESFRYKLGNGAPTQGTGSLRALNTESVDQATRMKKMPASCRNGLGAKPKRLKANTAFFRQPFFMAAMGRFKINLVNYFFHKLVSNHGGLKQLVFWFDKLRNHLILQIFSKFHRRVAAK